jgi:hypothetical protein
MLAMDKALTQLQSIEAAVADGDLELANNAAAKLKPLLIGENIDELLAVRKRIEALTLEVHQVRKQQSQTLKQIRQQRGGAAAYQDMQRM